MVDDSMVDDFLEHFGVKGMRWGHRKKRDEAARAARFGGQKTKDTKKPNRKERKAALAKDAEKFRQDVLKDVGSRPMNELYATTGRQGRMIQTGKEVIDAMNTGISVTSIASTGYKIGDD